MTWSNRGAVSMPKHVSKSVEMRDHRSHYILTMSSHAISRGLPYTHTRLNKIDAKKQRRWSACRMKKQKEAQHTQVDGDDDDDGAMVDGIV